MDTPLRTRLFSVYLNAWNTGVSKQRGIKLAAGINVSRKWESCDYSKPLKKYALKQAEGAGDFVRAPAG